MLFNFILAFALIGSAFSASREDANSYLDTILRNNLPLEANSSALSPVSLPDFQTEFNDQVGLVSVKVKNSFKKGKLNEVLNVQRATDCSPPYSAYGNAIINCTLELANLKMKYEVDIKYGRLPTVDAKVKTTVGRTLIDIQIVASQLSNYPTIHNYQITHLGTMRNTFTGLGLLNRFLKSLDEGYNPKAQTNMQSVLSNELRTALNRAMVRNPMPLP